MFIRFRNHTYNTNHIVRVTLHREDGQVTSMDVVQSHGKMMTHKVGGGDSWKFSDSCEKFVRALSTPEDIDA